MANVLATFMRKLIIIAASVAALAIPTAAMAAAPDGSVN
jgi:hypothetical protein